MFIICIESSHQRGMGHFYRALIIQEYLKKKKEKNLIVINDDKVSVKILREKNITYETVDYSDVTSNWEKRIICTESLNSSGSISGSILFSNLSKSLDR